MFGTTPPETDIITKKCENMYWGVVGGGGGGGGGEEGPGYLLSTLSCICSSSTCETDMEVPVP